MSKLSNKELKKVLDKYIKEQQRYTYRIFASSQPEIERIFKEHQVEIQRIYRDYIEYKVNTSIPFRYKDYPHLEAYFSAIQVSLQASIYDHTLNEVAKAWLKSNKDIDSIVKSVFPNTPRRRLKKYLDHNKAAQNAFINRKISSGRTLSGRTWLLSNHYLRSIEDTLTIGILNGDSAENLGKRITRYLNNPQNKIDDISKITDKTAKSLLEQRLIDEGNKPNKVLKSTKYHAKMLAANETNLAYRNAETERISKLDFIVGYEIKLSNAHPRRDICDDMVGKYPKNFKWNGWHPNCYDEETEVYTNQGWKLFKDVADDDMILSLNPETYDLEYSAIELKQAYHKKGEMVHFHNRALDILVTPDHDMLVVSKNDNRTIRRVKAQECGVSQIIYRSSEWVGQHRDFINIGGLTIPFSLFCKFMGYYLSDGSLGHAWEIVIAQQCDNKYNIFDCIEDMGLKPRYNGGRVEVNNKDLYLYLKQFGLAPNKYVPNEIKESRPCHIQIFLDAFISCDGYIRKPRPFIGNRGGMCNPKDGERSYFTTSKKMADDIGELILKIGRRPSFSIKPKGKTIEFKNGPYTTNYDCWIISECRAKTATQYKKEVVKYDGMVYDLTLAKNNTMYIRRNGKCFWGSNCLCYRVPILKTMDELTQDNLLILEGKEPTSDSVNKVTDIPENAKHYLQENYERFSKYANKPYFWQDNLSIIKSLKA